MSAGFKRRALRMLRRMRGLLVHLFLVQLQPVEHGARRKAVLTPRRAGKTEMACIWLLDAADKNPGKKFLYVALTRPNAKDIAWEMFRRLDKLYRLGCHFHKDELTITLPNGAQIMLRGADQENWISRLEGQEFMLIIVDEAGLYTISLRKLIYDALSPMVDSCGGTICLIGRPGLVKTDLFWDITRPDLRHGPKDADGAWTVLDQRGGKEWAVFNWSTLDNPYVAARWRAEIEEKLRINPDIINDPGFRRNYLGEWAEDVEGLVYAFDADRNLIDTWKPEHGDEYGLTTDFGWDDAQGFMIGCWNPNRPHLVVVESYKQRNMPLSDALDRMARYRATYPGLRMWGDPARKQLFMEMSIRFGACVQPAQKEEKCDNIELMNHDFALGMIQIVRQTNPQYIDELQSLRKLISTTIVDAALNEERPGRWVEHPKMANDLCDCGLYLWRHSRHYRFQAQPRGPIPGPAQIAEMQVREAWEAEAQARKRKEQKGWWKR